jgi:hypothetical protein
MMLMKRKGVIENEGEEVARSIGGIATGIYLIK